MTGDLSSAISARMESGPGRKVMTVGKATTTLSFKSVSGDLAVIEPRDSGVPLPVVAAGQPAVPAAQTTSMPAFAADSPAPEGEPRPEVEAAQLAILRSLEGGEIDVAAAMTQLAAIEEA